MTNLNISAKELLEMMAPPGLNLTDGEKKLMFFRDLAAQYAAKAKYGNTPSHNNIARAAQTFGGIGSGGADPMMMMLLTKMIGNDEKPAEDNAIDRIEAAVGSLCDRIEAIESHITV